MSLTKLTGRAPSRSSPRHGRGEVSERLVRRSSCEGGSELVGGFCPESLTLWPKLRRAFTLVEIMVVILVLAILASIIVPQVTGRAIEARRAKAISDLATLRSLVQGFNMDTDRLPTQQEGLDALTTAPLGIKHWNGPYITPLPLDPWGRPYVYVYPGQNGPRSFRLMSYGTDGAEGGEGDAQDIIDDGK